MTTEATLNRSWIPRDDAFNLAAKLAEVGVYTTLRGGPRGWQVEFGRHTDLIAAMKVIDTIKVGGDQEKPLNAYLYPFGGEDRVVLIFYGSKP